MRMKTLRGRVDRLTAKPPRKTIFKHEEHEGRKIDGFKRQKTFFCILLNSFFLRVHGFVVNKALAFPSTPLRVFGLAPWRLGRLWRPSRFLLVFHFPACLLSHRHSCLCPAGFLLFLPICILQFALCNEPLTLPLVPPQGLIHPSSFILYPLFWRPWRLGGSRFLLVFQFAF